MAEIKNELSFYQAISQELKDLRRELKEELTAIMNLFNTKLAGVVDTQADMSKEIAQLHLNLESLRLKSEARLEMLEYKIKLLEQVKRHYLWIGGAGMTIGLLLTPFVPELGKIFRILL